MDTQTTAYAHTLQDLLHAFRRMHFTPKHCNGLKNSEKHVLMLIATLCEEKLPTPSDIAKRIDVTLAAITHHLNSLEQKNLITRTSDHEDRRLVYIALTPKGEKEFERVKKEFFSKMYDLVTYLGEKDTKTLIAILQRLHTFAQQYQEKE